MESELTAHRKNTRRKGEVLCSLINIYFRECMIQVWGNWNFQFNIEYDVLMSWFVEYLNDEYELF